MGTDEVDAEPDEADADADERSRAAAEEKSGDGAGERAGVEAVRGRGGAAWVGKAGTVGDAGFDTDRVPYGGRRMPLIAAAPTAGEDGAVDTATGPDPDSDAAAAAVAACDAVIDVEKLRVDKLRRFEPLRARGPRPAPTPSCDCCVCALPNELAVGECASLRISSSLL